LIRHSTRLARSDLSFAAVPSPPLRRPCQVFYARFLSPHLQRIAASPPFL
jgi:hypothetical protein